MGLTDKKITNHIDKSVIYLFLITFLISASVLAYKSTKHTPCKEVKLVVKSKDFVEDKLIRFVDRTENATSWEWDFGDSTKVLTTREALHVYKKPGQYKVTLTVNGICSEARSVIVKQKPFVVDSTKLAIFDLPKTIEVGKEITVIDKTPNATTWEWRFGETAGVNSTKKMAKYVYETPGLKTVALVVNGDVKHATNKLIEVLAIKKPQDDRSNRIKTVKRTVGKIIKDVPETAPLGVKPEVKEEPKAPKTVPYISDSQFKNKLLLVVKSKLKANAFAEYLCGDLNKKIIVNGSPTTFLAFCELIKDKKLKIKEVNLYRNKGSNCITNITIKRSKFIF